jgi:muramidase (phage lysozyme)
MGTWMAAQAVKEGEIREALGRLNPLWGELFPVEQARIVRALVERVVVGPAGAGI